VKLKPFLLSSLFSLLGMISPELAHAQFIGYTSPQTVQQTLATNTACTGSPQLFSVQNLGQTQHQATATVSAASVRFTMQFLGQDAAGNTFPISEIATAQNNAPITNGVLQAAGYFPIVKLQVICSPGAATFTLNYSGSSSTPVFGAGGYQVTQYDKVLFIAQSQTGTSPNVAITSPTFNSSGNLIFTYSAAPSGSTGSLVFTCASQIATVPFNNATSLTFTLANVNTVQVFQVPSLTCPFPSVLYSPPGTPNGTFNLEYVVNPLGASVAADPCASAGTPKSSVAINAAATAQLVPILNNSAVYVCGYSFTIAGSATATAQLEYGTGATCGTGTTVLTGSFLGGTAPVPITSQAVPGTVAKTPAGNALCLVAGGATPSIQGVLTYVQQ